MEITSETNTQKPKKGKWILIVLTAILIIGGTVGYLQYQEKQEQAKAEEKRKKLKKYGETLELAGISMVITAATAEEMNNQYYSVWRDAIYEDKVVVNGETAYDFNKAIQLQHAAFESDGKLSDLQAGVEVANQYMKDLRNPPAKYKDAYEALIDMYKPFQKYTSLAESPDGSLQSFSETTNQLVSEINATHDEFEIKLP
jgi:hypothetical protein